ncbi:MFS transporter [Streptomyces monticola]|uniref:MFS transporter n=1 Tax=Streptomyces monticola TaxID=2666263 RepID=A0ABW2JU93_9ACTN
MVKSPYSPPPAVAPARAGRSRLPLWGLLAVLAGNMLIDALEVSVVVVALPSLAADLGLAPVSAQWAMTGFAAGFGGLLLFGARVVALLGRRRVYLTALLVFAAASVVAALATDPVLLVATRFVKGFCAALTAPTGLAIISTTFPAGPQRQRALSVYTLFGASGFTAGLLLSGALTEISWRLTFFFPAPVVLVLFALGLRLVPGPDAEPAPPGAGQAAEQPAPRRYDFAGALTFAAGLAALVQGIVSLPAHGWADPRSTGLLALAVAAFAAFTVIERRVPEPLVDFRVFTSGAMVRSALGAAALNGSYLGLLFTLTYQLQVLSGWSPLHTALALLPAAAPLAVTALHSGRLVAGYGATRLITAGALFAFVGYLLQLRQSWPLQYASDLLLTTLLVGAAFVCSFAALNLRATAELPPAERGAGSGVYQTAVQTGAALVLAAVAALLPASAAAAQADPLRACRPALVLVAAVGAAGLLVALTGRRTRRP